MKAGKYRLQAVLDVRARAQQEAGKTIALRRTELAEAELELRQRLAAAQHCRQQQQTAQVTLRQTLARGTRIRTINLHRTHLADLRLRESALQEAVEKQRAVVFCAEQALEQARVNLIEAAKQVRVIEKHRDNWQREQRRAGEHSEQKAMDEAGAIVHRRQSGI